MTSPATSVNPASRGLSAAAAADRLAQDGPNVVTAPPRRGILLRVGRQLADPPRRPEVSRELILCALHRLGKPSMAADVADQAAALALSEPGWPRNTGAKFSPASAAAHLNQIAEKAGTARDTSGNNRPLFQPKGGTFDPNYPMPEPPRPPRAEPEGRYCSTSRHPLGASPARGPGCRLDFTGPHYSRHDLPTKRADAAT